MTLFEEWLPVILPVIFALVMISVFMGMCAYAVLAERKICSYIQGRVGPNRTRLPLIGNVPILGWTVLFLCKHYAVQSLYGGLNINAFRGLAK